MNEHDRLREEAQKQDCGFKAMALYKQANRKEREFIFIHNILPKIAKHCVLCDGNGKYTFQSTFGLIDFFPKSNRILIRSQNKWKNDGTGFIEQFVKNRG